jgi:hypothetical protein
VGVRVVRHTIRSKIRKGIVDSTLLDVKKATYLFDTETLLVEQGYDLSLQISREREHAGGCKSNQMTDAENFGVAAKW